MPNTEFEVSQIREFTLAKYGNLVEKCAVARIILTEDIIWRITIQD